jgi:hypothetical protein
MMQKAGAQSVSGWKVLYDVWPKLSGTQRVAASFIGSDGFQGLISLYPLINILLYVLILGALLFWRFRNEDII